MTLDEAIKHAEEVAEEKENEGKLLCQSEGASIGCLISAKEHRKLAEWLKELKQYKEYDMGKQALRGFFEGIGTPVDEQVDEQVDDCISRQAAIDIVDGYGVSQSNVEDVTQDIISDIIALPPVTPQQKTGRWMRKTKVDGVYDIAGVKTWGIKCQCDRCDFSTTVIEDFGYYKWCPHCGSRMTQEVEE